jgi:hypothetical protein
MDRTGHKSSQMIALYARQARTWAELSLGPLLPLDTLLLEVRRHALARDEARGIAAGPSMRLRRTRRPRAGDAKSSGPTSGPKIAPTAGLERVSGLFCKCATSFRLSSNRSSPLAFLPFGHIHGSPLKSTGVDPSHGTLVARPEAGDRHPTRLAPGGQANTRPDRLS